MLGIAALVAILGDPTDQDELIAAHHRGWYVIAAAMLLASVIGLRQIGRTRKAPAGDDQ